MWGSSDRIVLTGATGFLGSHLMAALLEQGKHVTVLGRASGRISLEERVAVLLTWFGMPERKGQVETVEADLLAPHLGLGPAKYLGICLKTEQIIHCASDTRFSESNRLASIDTNVRSLLTVLELARQSKVSFFHYVSTAYVSGPTDSPCLEAPVAASSFANVYEETKAWAEKEVVEHCERYGISYTILRPSIVYGDSRTGRSTSFTALYHHVRSLYLIRDIYLKEITEHGGEKSRRHHIFLDRCGTLHIPLKIHLPRRGSINLIPIDYFVASVLAVLERGEPGIYHLTSDRPESMESLASYCETFLNLEGIEIVYGTPPPEYCQNPAEALFDKFVEPYRPYLSDPRSFDRRNTDLATSGLAPPKLTYDIFRRCMEYAVAANWGK